MKLFSTTIKIGCGVAANLALFKYALDCNDKHARFFQQLPKEEQNKLRAREFFLQQHPGYNAGDPYLSAMIRSGYDSHQELRAKHLLNNSFRKF